MSMGGCSRYAFSTLFNPLSPYVALLCVLMRFSCVLSCPFCLIFLSILLRFLGASPSGERCGGPCETLNTNGKTSFTLASLVEWRPSLSRCCTFSTGLPSFCRLCKSTLASTKQRQSSKCPPPLCQSSHQITEKSPHSHLLPKVERWNHDDLWSANPNPGSKG